MNIWQNLRSVFYASDMDREIIDEVIRKKNFRRALYIVCFSVAVNIFLALFFKYNLSSGSAIGVKWQESLVSLHVVLLCVNIALAAFALFINYKHLKFKSAFSALLPAILITLLFPVAVAVSLSQVQSIIPFFIVCVASSTILIVRPAVSLLLFAVAFTIYYSGITLIQPDTEILAANRLNGFIVVIVCFGLSVFNWRNHIKHYRQKHKLILQKQELEEKYNALLDSTEQLAAANATKDKFFSIIAHDLRGPINSTVSLSELLIDGSQIDSQEEHNHMLKMLHDSLTSTNKLLSNLLLWARAQTSDIGILKVKTSLREHVQENIDLLYSLASVKNITLNNCVDDNMFVFADPEMLNTILRNLISNAIKFTNNNGIINLKTENRVTENNQQFIEVCVKDNGIGMDAKKIENLFRKDKIVSTSGTNHETGTGFGLILCKEFIEKHEGKIWVESQPGKGSCFAFTLPKA